MTGINFTRQAGGAGAQAGRRGVRTASRDAGPNPISERHSQKAGRRSRPLPTHKDCMNAYQAINFYHLKTVILNSHSMSSNGFYLLVAHNFRRALTYPHLPNDSGSGQAFPPASGRTKKNVAGTVAAAQNFLIGFLHRSIQKVYGVGVEFNATPLMQ
jgi:hypothetical protein